MHVVNEDQPQAIEAEQEPLQITPPRTLTNASTKGYYTPAAWPVRAGGSDHLQHASKGF